MSITDAFVLPPDVRLVEVATLPVELRAQLGNDEGDYALSRTHSRLPSQLIDANAAKLVGEFRQASTLVGAILRFSRATQTDPTRTLEDAFPLLERLIGSGLLVPPDSDEARAIAPMLSAGDRVGAYTVTRCLQVTEDSEIHEVADDDGHPAALKQLRAAGRHTQARLFERERRVLERLDGSVNPRLLAHGLYEDLEHLVMAWCPGEDAMTRASRLRAERGSAALPELLALARAVLAAYARLHAQGALHGDVHPRNAIVGPDGSVRLIDYGLSAMTGVVEHAERGGVPFFFEPEYALAAIEARRPPAVNARSEQYSLAALLFMLLSGVNHLEFSLEHEQAMRQIASETPRRLSDAVVGLPDGLEAVFERAFERDPERRFESLEAMLSAWDAGLDRARATFSARPNGAGSVLDSALETVLEQVRPGGAWFESELAPAPVASVNYGSAGIAYALARIACAREDASLLSLADEWFWRATREAEREDAFLNPVLEMDERTVGRVSPYHSRSGLFLTQAQIARAMSDALSHAHALAGFAQVSALECEALDVTLGRAGTLLSSAWLLEGTRGTMLDGTPAVSAILETGTRSMQQIETRLVSLEPIAACKDVHYLGAAHGWAGILYALLCWARTSGQPVPDGLETRLSELSAFAQPHGDGLRWPWTNGMGHQASGFMPGWCNGSAGHVFLWTLAHRTFGDQTFLDLAERAAWNTYTEPSPTGNLCCGAAGQAYALLNLYRLTDDADWLERARELAERAAVTALFMSRGRHARELPAHSLYKGLVGVAVLAAELEQPRHARMPVFELEH